MPNQTKPMSRLLASNPPQKRINVTDILTQLIETIILQTGIFKHIDIQRILICIAFNRRNGRGGGIYGKLVPLKFKDGSSTLQYRGKYYTMPRIINKGIQQLYIIYFYTPKFFDLSPLEKLRVIFHELYHISPEFNGDIRRMGSFKAAHGSSTKRFNSKFEEELKIFYEYVQNTEFFSYLKMDIRSLRANYKEIYSRRMKLPKPVRIKRDQNT